MKKLNLDDPNVFDQWRANYWSMTNDEHLDFCKRAAEKWPGQKHYTFSNFENEIGRLYKPVVLEIGGWKGELAKDAFEKFPNICSWQNIDFCPVAMIQAVCEHPKYIVSTPQRFDWFTAPRILHYDICVSAHMIEHLDNKHFEQLAKFIAGIPIIIFEAPLKFLGNDWTGDWSTHKLEMGWKGVDLTMQDHGYRFEAINEWCRRYIL